MARSASVATVRVLPFSRPSVISVFEFPERNG
jgi:hypothetical protein